MPPLADLYIAGSDQIWNSNYNNGRDPAFYLDFGSININAGIIRCELCNKCNTRGPKTLCKKSQLKKF